ncbi:MAG TPA: hypothetical protein GX513_09265 [Firmicutes bacterium]|nr:hypothetical protein [Bacillota bacterium]
MADYDRRWRSLLGREIEVGVRFRQLARRVDDATLAFFIDHANRDGIKRAIQSHRLFDWHAPLLSALLDGPFSLLHRLCL